MRYRWLKALVLLILIISIFIVWPSRHKKAASVVPSSSTTTSVALWTAPDTASIPSGTEGDNIRYGRDLVANTAVYFGPKGKLGNKTNGMNCQNCHLSAGTAAWGNNYAAVCSTYPKFRERRGGMETVVQRITDCFERSLNGAAPDSTSREMKAMVAYMQWMAKDVPRGTKPPGCGLKPLAFLSRASDTVHGKIAYEQQCARCHGLHGEGQLNADGIAYLYPPVWGDHSYNTGAGLYRVSRFAAYIKCNMPYGTNYQHSVLTDEESWDIAAFVNSQPRPNKKFSKDWPDIKLKPVDHPFGPYADSFSEAQHKYGPFAIIQRQKDSLLKRKTI